MRKKMLSALLAVMTCTALFGTTVFASSFNGTMTTRGDQIVDGTSTVVNPVYSVVVPTSLVFGLDAFEQNGDSQVYSVDFPIVNKSNVDVKVDVALSVATAANVVFKDSADDVAHTGSTKDVWIAAAVPKTITEAIGTSANVVIGTKNLYKVTSTVGTGTTGIYVVATSTGDAETLATSVDSTVYATPTAVAVTQAPTNVTGTYTAATNQAPANYATFTLNSTASNLTFALEKATYLEYYETATDKKKAFDTMATSSTGSATYRFVGSINDAADWLANDITAKAIYNFNGLSDDNYATLTSADSKVEISTGSYAHALVKTVSNIPTLVSPTATYSKATGGKIQFNLGTGATAATDVASIKFGDSNTNMPQAWLKTSSFTGNELTLGSGAFATAAAGTKKYVEITMNDLASTKLIVEVTVNN